MKKATWQKWEDRVARLFGTRRSPNSGAVPEWSDETKSDTLHERLFIEVKTKARHALATLWRSTCLLSDDEGKVPVVALAEEGANRVWILVRDDHLQAVAAEYRGDPPPAPKGGVIGEDF